MAPCTNLILDFRRCRIWNGNGRYEEPMTEAVVTGSGAELARCPRARHASQVLRALAADPEPRLSLEELTRRLDDRSFGIVFLVMALINCMPLPPGVSTVTGVMMMLTAVQLLVGRHRLWLPGFIARRTIPRAGFRATVQRALPLLRRFEQMCRPRYSWLTRGRSERLIGLVVLILAFVITLPIPVIGNIPPGIAVAIIAVGLLERDGLAVLAGLAAGIAAFAINVGVVGAVAYAAFEPAGRLLRGAF